MRKISANLILPVSSAPLRNGIILLNPDGSIADLIDTAGNLREEPGLEFYPGTIIPGIVLPWFRLDNYPGHTDAPGHANHLNNQDSPDPSDSNNLTDSANSPDNIKTPEQELNRSFKNLELDLFRNGIKGVGLVLSDRLVSDEVLEQMSKSHLSFHPVIELCPGSDEDEFEVFNRGIELASRAFNEFHLSCSLSACSRAVKNSDMGKFLKEYGKSHQNILPPEGENSGKSHSSLENQFNILKNTLLASPEMDFEELIRQITLEAAAKIFENDVLGSIEVGKTPGLNLVSGYDSGNPARAAKLALKVLV